MVKFKELKKSPKGNDIPNLDNDDDADYYKKLADKNLKELLKSEGDLISSNEREFILKVRNKYRSTNFKDK